MSYTATSLWPDTFGTQGLIEFWLNSPEIPTAKAAVTRHKLAQPLLRGEVQKMWVNLFTYLCQARAAGPHPATADVVEFCQELAATRLLDREEVATIKHRLLTGTQREFEWQCRRLRAVVEARCEEYARKQVA